MLSVLAEGASPLQIAGLLSVLRHRGAEPLELAGFVDALRSQQVPISFPRENLVDTCGTGGGRPTLNLSTGAAFLAAGAGATVAKHGNRSVTSTCGSADVLESLGISLSSEPEHLSRSMAQTGLAFLFAPSFHPALKTIGPVRRELGMRTVFNQLGPLLNPAGARRQVIGVYSLELMRPMAEALLLLGSERAFVVHSEDGLDEFSPCAPTYVAEVFDGQVKEYTVSPADFGQDFLPHESIDQASSPAHAAELMREGLGDPFHIVFRAMIPNAAACLVAAGLESDWRSAAQRVIAAGRDGRALSALDQLVALSQETVES